MCNTSETAPSRSDPMLFVNRGLDDTQLTRYFNSSSAVRYNKRNHSDWYDRRIESNFYSLMCTWHFTGLLAYFISAHNSQRTQGHLGPDYFQRRWSKFPTGLPAIGHACATDTNTASPCCSTSWLEQHPPVEDSSELGWKPISSTKRTMYSVWST